MENYEILEHPIISEKAVSLIESENKIVFKVNKNANKQDIKQAVEKTYNVKVVAVNVINDTRGQKKAIVRLDAKNKASELASKLGMV
jgi:ribosomal protein uL23